MTNGLLSRPHTCRPGQVFGSGHFSLRVKKRSTDLRSIPLIADAWRSAWKMFCLCLNRFDCRPHFSSDPFLFWANRDAKGLPGSPNGAPGRVVADAREYGPNSLGILRWRLHEFACDLRCGRAEFN